MRIIFPAIVFILLLVSGCASGSGVYHTVGEGQTLYQIAKTYGVDVRYLARINGINDPTQLKSGSRLYIPDADRVLRVPATVGEKSPPAATSTRSTKPSATKPKPSVSTQQPSVPKPPPPTIQTKKPSVPAVEASLNFVWPLKGKIVKTFGDQGGKVQKGLEIAATPGTTILSAAAGQIIYSGDGLPGYGNLIIIKHSNSFFTVYGFNQRNLVVNGAFVSQGEKIALSGTPPGGGTPRLHFEIRQGKEAVNPIFYLP